MYYLLLDISRRVDVVTMNIINSKTQMYQSYLNQYQVRMIVFVKVKAFDPESARERASAKNRCKWMNSSEQESVQLNPIILRTVIISMCAVNNQGMHV